MDILHKSDDLLIEQEELSESREICDNNFRESVHMTPEISSARKIDQCLLDEKIEVVVEASIKANEKPSNVSDSLTSGTAASVATVDKQVEESDDEKTFTPQQNPEVGSSCSNCEESKVVESQTTNFSEDLPEPATINISSLFLQPQVDEQCHANEEKSEPEDASPISTINSKLIDMDCEIINIEFAEGKEILDISDDRIIEQEGAAGSRALCDKIFRESEYMTTDISNAQRLDQCVLDEKVKVVSEVMKMSSLLFFWSSISWKTIAI